MLRGKGVWARGRELDRALQIAPRMGATHVFYKVGQGSTYYGGMADAARRIKRAGLVPFGWTWLLLDDPQAEAHLAVRAFQDGFQGVIFDTEANRCRNRFDQASQMGHFLRAAEVDLNKLYNCSFPNISHHRDLPYDQMNEFCKGGLMPMSYGTFFAPGSTVPPDRQAQRVIDEWTYGHYEYWAERWGYRPPLYPVLGPYHDEHGNVRMSPDEFQIWLDRLEAHRPTFFSVFTAAVINDDLLPLIRAFSPDEPIPEPPSGVKVEVVSPEMGFLNIRVSPSTDHLPVTEVRDGVILEALESEEAVEAKVGQQDQWLRVRIPGGVEGYAAAWHLCIYEEVVEPEIKVVVVSPELGFLNVRPTPSTGQSPIAQVEHGAVLSALESEERVRARVGRENRWLRVRTPGGREGYVAAWYLRLEEDLVPSEVQVKIISPEMGYLNVRPTPSTQWPPIGKVDHGVVVDALEPKADVKSKIGQEGQWIRIRTPSGTDGYVAAWYLQLHEKELAPKIDVLVRVVSPDLGFLNVRLDPSTQRPPVTQVDHGVVLDAQASKEEVEAKVGQPGEWLAIRTPDGDEGFVAAQYLTIHEEMVGKITHVTVQSSIGLNVRKRDDADSDVIWRVGDKTVLRMKEVSQTGEDKIGKDRWLKIKTPSRREGYVNGLYLQPKRLADKRLPVVDSTLPAGESAWIFGVHAAGATTPANFKSLFRGKRKTGWVLFTEAVGSDPDHGGGHDYTSWSHDGYGVIVRLNNGYEPAGTLPVRAKYDDFARACARYVQNSRGCHIWVIGNEQNNVREHPGGAEDPVEHITPQRYAEAFNLARRRIKSVQPEAVVVLGAVDPYNTFPWELMDGKRYRPLDYFREMLSYISDLDGIALHTYTHWLDVDLITRKTVFTDEFLQPGTPKEHYYDFQAYRSFVEAIPAKWNDRPVYITESNHWVALDHEPRTPDEISNGWLDRNAGWVRAAYKEINRWNRMPHAQQIHCLLLYRWTGDAWAIKEKKKVQKDFRQTLDNDYRWRR